MTEPLRRTVSPLLRIEQRWPIGDGRTFFEVETKTFEHHEGEWLNVVAASPGVVYGVSSLPVMNKETAAAVGKALTEWAGQP